MNCDDAFDQMTSAGAQDNAALRQHLNQCPRCRDMQETLSPVIAWMSASGMPAGDLPSTASPHALFLTEDAVQVAERAAHRLRSHRSFTSRPGASRRTVGTVCALAGLLAGFYFAIVIPSVDSPRGGAPTARSSSAELVCLWKLPANDQSRITPSADQLIATCAACHLASR